MSILSSLGEKIGIKKGSGLITQLADKWIAPEHKDMVESLATSIVLPMIAPTSIFGLSDLATRGLFGAAGAWANKQDPIAGFIGAAYTPKVGGWLQKQGLSPAMAGGVAGASMAAVTGGDPLTAGIGGYFQGGRVSANTRPGGGDTPGAASKGWNFAEGWQNMNNAVTGQGVSTSINTGLLGTGQTQAPAAAAPVQASTGGTNWQNILAGAAAGTIPALMGGSSSGGSTAQAPTTSTSSQAFLSANGGNDEMLTKLISQKNSEIDQAVEAEAKQLSDHFVGRGLHGSGLEQQAYSDLMSKATKAREDAANAVVLEIYNAKQNWLNQQLNRDAQAQELYARLQAAEREGDENKKIEIWGMIADIAGKYLANAGQQQATTTPA
jgi:hypothetical protein